ncbi:MAG: DUF2339 domain-containing protein [Gammaproteobacteria bacterium]|nr:DUF2339 domain-containing protein [Gammaproteobacteria bacterium]
MAGAAIGWLLVRVQALELRVDRLERDSAEGAGHGPPRAPSVSAAVPEPVVRDEAEPASAPPEVASAARPEPRSPAKPAPGPVPRHVLGPAARRSEQWGAADGAAPDLLPDILKLRDWLFGGNPLVRLGAVLLLIGMGFLAAFLAERGLVPPGVRLAGIAAVGLVLTGLGFRLRTQPGGYGLVLQGAGIAVLYLTVFAGLQLYGLYGPVPAFAVLVVIVALAAGLAVLQNGLPLALFATVGGFAAPLVTSDGSGEFVTLMGYYAVLNLGVLGIAWYRAWRSLNWVSFAFTATMGTLWSLTAYSSEDYLAAQWLLLYFFLLFAAIPVLFARATERLTGVGGVLDGALIFGTPAVAFTLQAGLVADTRFGVAISALAAGTVYGLLGRSLWRRRAASTQLLAESNIALAVVFATLAIPFLFHDGALTAAAWALQGAGLVWLGRRQRRRLPEFAGLGLQGCAFLAWMIGGLGGPGPADTLPYLNAWMLSALLMGIAAFASALFIERDGEPAGTQSPLWVALLVWAALLVLGAGWLEAYRQFTDPIAPSLQALWLAVVVLACRALPSRWLGPAWLVCAGPPLLALLMFRTATELPGAGVFSSPAAVSWPLAWGAVLLALLPSRSPAMPRHFGQGVMAFLAGLLPAWALHSALAGTAASVWGFVQWGVVPALFALLILQRRPTQLPLSLDPVGWNHGIGALCAWMMGWALIAVAHPGAAAPLPWVPLFNPLELTQWLVLLVVLRLRTRLELPADLHAAVLPALAGLAFAVSTAMAARSVHHLTGAEWTPVGLFQSELLQTMLALLWTLFACGALAVGHRTARRGTWVAGAALLAVVVVKLFAVDLAGSGTLPRIVSFLGVGGLVLVMGYFNPLPPKAEPS